jgi:hypothetical protein
VPAFLNALGASITAGAGMAVPRGDVALSNLSELCRQAFPQGFSLILDDYHLVANDDLDQLVCELPARLTTLRCLLLTSRQELTVPLLPRWLARREAVQVFDTDLRLEPADIAAWLGVSATDAVTIHDQTRGWFVALNLLQEARHYGGEAKNLFQENLAHYLLDDVLGNYDPALVHFLAVTSLMGDFTANDCEAVGLRDVDSSLARLRADRLFLRQEGDLYTSQAVIRSVLADTLAPRERQTWQHRIAAHRFDQGHQSCLSLYIGAAAWQDACRAIVWFHHTHWLGQMGNTSTSRYWLDHVPAARLDADPWYRLACLLVAEAGLDRSARLSLIERLVADFAACRDAEGHAFAVLHQARAHEDFQDFAALRDCLAVIRTARQSMPIGHPASDLLQDVTLRSLQATMRESDRVTWEAGLAELRSRPARTPMDRYRRFQLSYGAASQYLHLGEFTTAYHYLQLMAEMVSWDHARRGWCVIIQAELSEYTEFPPVVAAAEMAAIFAAEPVATPVRLAQVWIEAIGAWQQGDWLQAERAYERMVALGASLDASHFRVFAMVHLRLADLAMRQGNLAVARQACEAAKTCNTTAFDRTEIDWQLARIHAATGNLSLACDLVARAEADFRKHDAKFHVVLALILGAALRGEPVPAEARDIVSRWQYRFALQQRYPEALDLLDGAVAMPVPQARVQIFSLGGFRVIVDGKEIAWRRSNSQLVLLHLLMHPEGTSAADLERRYWQATGNAGLRTDVFALRQVLEPATPAKESRYVIASSSLYRWTRDKSLYWWDVEEFEAQAHRALEAEGEDAKLARQQALALYSGAFVPEWQSVLAFDRKRQQLAQLSERLRT